MRFRGVGAGLIRRHLPNGPQPPVPPHDGHTASPKERTIASSTAPSPSDNAAGESRPWLARSLPFALFIALFAVDPWLAAAFEGSLDPRWMYGVRSLLTAGCLLFFWRRYSELREGAPTARSWLLAVLAGLLVFAFWIRLDFGILVIGSSGEGYDPRIDGRLWTVFTLVRLGGSALVVPVMEELFWRSFIMRWIAHPRFTSVDPRKIGLKPLVISSALFATEHHLWFAGFLAGLIYGELYRRTGNIWVPIIAHAVTNGVLGYWVTTTGSWGFW